MIKLELKLPHCHTMQCGNLWQVWHQTCHTTTPLGVWGGAGQGIIDEVRCGGKVVAKIASGGILRLWALRWWSLLRDCTNTRTFAEPNPKVVSAINGLSGDGRVCDSLAKTQPFAEPHRKLAAPPPAHLPKSYSRQPDTLDACPQMSVSVRN